MTSDGLRFIQWFFSEFWKLFNSWYIPGTAITPAAAMFGLIAIPLALKTILSIVRGIEIPTKFAGKKYIGSSKGGTSE